MLTLRTFKPFRGTMSASPFALKADALLAMSGLPYERDFQLPIKQPMEKLPVLEDGDKLIPDSTLIQHHLEAAHGIDFDGSLTDDDRAKAIALQRLVEEHLYFLGAHYRWTLYPDVLRQEYFGHVPALIRGLIFRKVDKQRIANLHGQGISRHEDAQMRIFIQEDVDTIACMLGDKDFLFGDKPTSIDASVWGCIHGTLCCDLDTPGKRAMAAYPSLAAYEKRFRERFYGGE